MALTYWLIRRFGAEAQAGYGIGAARDAGDLPAGDGGGVLGGAHRGPELRRAPRRSRARDVSHGGAARDRRHGGDHAAVSASRRARSSARSRSDPKVIAVGTEFLQHHLVELRRERHHLHLLRHVPGDGQHVAGAAERREPPGDLRACRRCGCPRRPGFNLHTVWEVSVVTIVVQAVLSYVLLQREMRKKLAFAPPRPPSPWLRSARETQPRRCLWRPTSTSFVSSML